MSLSLRTLSSRSIRARRVAPISPSKPRVPYRQIAPASESRRSAPSHWRANSSGGSVSFSASKGSIRIVSPKAFTHAVEPGGCSQVRVELLDDLQGALGVRRQPREVGVDAHDRGVVGREVDVDVAAVGDAARVADGLGLVLAEGLPHLRGRLHVQVAGVAHPRLVALDLAHRDAAQRVVRVPVVGGQEVRVVVAHQRDAQLFREPDRQRVDVALQLLLVLLELQEEAGLAVLVGPEDAQVPLGLLDRRVPVLLLLLAAPQVLHEVVRDGRPQVAVDRDQPVAPLRERLVVHARLVVEALQEAVRGELPQVRPAGLVLGQQHQVEAAVGGARVLLVAAVRGPALQLGGDVGLQPEDRLDPGLPRGVVELDGAEEVAVVGDRHGVHPQLLHAGDEAVDPVAAVEQGVGGVQVEVDEITRLVLGGGGADHGWILSRGSGGEGGVVEKLAPRGVSGAIRSRSRAFHASAWLRHQHASPSRAAALQGGARLSGCAGPQPGHGDAQRPRQDRGSASAGGSRTRATRPRRRAAARGKAGPVPEVRPGAPPDAARCERSEALA